MRIKTDTRRNWGTDHHYIVEPVGLAELWEKITGRKTVTQVDLDNLHALARHFGAGLSSERLS